MRSIIFILISIIAYKPFSFFVTEQLLQYVFDARVTSEGSLFSLSNSYNTVELDRKDSFWALLRDVSFNPNFSYERGFYIDVNIADCDLKISSQGEISRFDNVKYLNFNVKKGKVHAYGKTALFFCKDRTIFLEINNKYPVSIFVEDNSITALIDSLDIDDIYEIPNVKGYISGRATWDMNFTLDSFRITTNNISSDDLNLSFLTIGNGDALKATLACSLDGDLLSGTFVSNSKGTVCDCEGENSKLKFCLLDNTITLDLISSKGACHARGHRAKKDIFLDVDFSKYDLSTLAKLIKTIYPGYSVNVAGDLSGSCFFHILENKLTEFSVDNIVLNDFLIEKGSYTLLSPSCRVEHFYANNVVDMVFNCDNLIIKNNEDTINVETKINISSSNWVDSGIYMYNDVSQISIKLTNGLSNLLAVADFKGSIPRLFLPKNFYDSLEAPMQDLCFKGNCMAQLNGSDVIVNSSFLVNNNFELTLLADYKLWDCCKSVYLATRNLDLKNIETPFGLFSGDFDLVVHYASDLIHTEFVGNYVVFSNRNFYGKIPLRDSFLRFGYDLKNESWTLKGKTHQAAIELPRHNISFSDIDCKLNCSNKFCSILASDFKYLDSSLSGSMMVYPSKNEFSTDFKNCTMQLTLERANGSIKSFGSFLKICGVDNFPAIDGKITLTKNMRLLTDFSDRIFYNGEFSLDDICFNYCNDILQLSSGSCKLRLSNHAFYLFGLVADLSLFNKTLEIDVPYFCYDNNKIDFDFRLHDGLFDIARLVTIPRNDGIIAYDPVLSSFLGLPIQVDSIDRKGPFRLHLKHHIDTTKADCCIVPDITVDTAYELLLCEGKLQLGLSINYLEYKGWSLKDRQINICISQNEDDSFKEIYKSSFSVDLSDREFTAHANLCCTDKYAMKISDCKLNDETIFIDGDVCWDREFLSPNLALKLLIKDYDWKGLTFTNKCPLRIDYFNDSLIFRDIDCKVVYLGKESFIKAEKAYLSDDTISSQDVTVDLNKSFLPFPLTDDIHATVNYDYNKNEATFSCNASSPYGDFKDVNIHYQNDLITYRANLVKEIIAFSLQGFVELDHLKGFCKLQSQGDVLRLHWRYSDGFLLDHAQGNFYGLGASFFRDGDKSYLDMSCDFTKITRVLPDSLLRYANVLQLGNGYFVKGTFKDDRFEGVITGKNFECYGHKFGAFSALTYYDKGKLSFKKGLLSDEALILSVSDLDIDISTGELNLPRLELKSFRPSLLTSITKGQEEIDPFLVTSFLVKDFSGNINDITSFKASGYCNFINSFKRDYTILDIPADLIGGIFGLDMELLIPVRGKFVFNIDNGIARITKLKNAFSENCRSQFFLTGDPSYVDSNGTIDINMAMKQFVLFKFTENLLLSIKGSIFNPKISFRYRNKKTSTRKRVVKKG